MHAENLVRDQRSDRQVIEQIDEFLPQLQVVPSFAFVQKTVDFSDVLVFVVASQQVNRLGVFDFVSHE